MAQNSFNHFDKIADAIKPACKQVVRKVVLDAQAQTQSRAPVDTGFLKNSVYTVTSDSSTYQGGAEALPEVAKPSSETEAYVAVGANYAIYVEFGARGRPPKPYFYPALEAVRPGFEKAMELIEAKMNEATR